MSQGTRPVPTGFSEHQLHTLFDLISDGIWDWNALTSAWWRNWSKGTSRWKARWPNAPASCPG